LGRAPIDAQRYKEGGGEGLKGGRGLKTATILPSEKGRNDHQASTCERESGRKGGVKRKGSKNTGRGPNAKTGKTDTLVFGNTYTGRLW